MTERKPQNGDFRTKDEIVTKDSIITEIYINGQWYTPEEADKLVFEIQADRAYNAETGLKIKSLCPTEETSGPVSILIKKNADE